MNQLNIFYCLKQRPSGIKHVDATEAHEPEGGHITSVTDTSIVPNAVLEKSTDLPDANVNPNNGQASYTATENRKTANNSDAEIQSDQDKTRDG